MKKRKLSTELKENVNLMELKEFPLESIEIRNRMITKICTISHVNMFPEA